MMKKLLIFILIFGLANSASATIHYELQATDLGGGQWSIDILATDPRGVATHLIGSGELVLTIMGNAAITDVSALTYAPSQVFWDPGMGLLHQEIVAPNGKSGLFGASSVSTMDMFWMTMPDIVQGNIIVTVYGEPAYLAIFANNTPNAFGNTLYYDGTQAVRDLEATRELIMQVGNTIGDIYITQAIYDLWVSIGRPFIWLCAGNSRGDANDDGYTNATDVGEIINHLGQPTSWENCHADLNRDGFVNPTDVGQIINNLDLGHGGTCWYRYLWGD